MWDVLVVGGGHAGCEAALAAARLLTGRVLLVTGAIDRIAAMSCNPAIGGVGKGHLVRELDALGGEMGRVADATGIHFRTLNESRGPAVRATRCQSDMERYRAMMSAVVLGQERLEVRQDDVVGLLVEDHEVRGVVTKLGQTLRAKKTILTTGTFLGGKLHRGNSTQAGGRAGEAPASGLSTSMSELGLELGRLKTGTCPRIDRRSIDERALDVQVPDDPAPRFSFDALNTGGDLAWTAPPLPQVSCLLTWTNANTHEVIHEAVARGVAPLFNGQIDGAGPRYCPSLEDKVVRFPDKARHQVFLEPQGLNTHEVYPSGLSTSLAPDEQLAFLRTIEGLEDVRVTRWGYAVEYDFVQPTQLDAALRVRTIPGLYTAGQINGTTGYEEAAIQGLLAGINAAHEVLEKEPFILARHEAYAGVLVDDLITRGTEEPYRMFTSRAEHRLILREDNVAARLYDRALEVGLLGDARADKMRTFERAVDEERARLSTTMIRVGPEANAILARAGTAVLKESQLLAKIMRRPEVSAAVAAELAPSDAPRVVQMRALNEVKYAGYIERAMKQLEKDRALEDQALPSDLFGERLPGMSLEVHEKLAAVQPRTLGQAARISGVTPAAIALLAVELQRRAG